MPKTIAYFRVFEIQFFAELRHCKFIPIQGWIQE